MAGEVYTPTVWQNGTDGGTPITAERLNNMEAGISAALPSVGDVLISKTYVNPALRYGGEWEYSQTHMFSGWHIYERTA